MNLALILSLLAVAICVAAVVAQRRSQSKIEHERDGLSAFRLENKNRGYSDALLEGSYLYLAERAPAPGPHYAVSMGDNLQHTYGLSDLDLEDAVIVIADKAGGRIPTSQELDALKTSVTTVEDMLRFLKPYFQK